MSVTIDNIVYTVTSSVAYVSGFEGTPVSLEIQPTVIINENSYNVTSIGSSAFLNCSSLVSITIPDSVTSIGSSAFKNCSSLVSITIPVSVTSIGSSAFQNCSSLVSITIPDSVTSISDYTFTGCLSLVSVTIPNSVASIGISSFSICSSLNSITIPNSVTYISNGAFQSSGLTSIDIPNSISVINNYTFRSCKSLVSVTIPNSVQTIRPYSFADCSELPHIDIPNSVTSIGVGAFLICSNLISVVIQNQKSIGSINTISFTNVSTNPNSTIRFYNTTDYNDLDSIWQTIATYYAIQLYDSDPTITGFSIPEKTYGDSPFQITQPISDSDGVFTYTSSNQEVATIDGNMITIVGAGQATITANQASTADYNSGSVTTTFTVNKADPNIGPLTIEAKTYGDSPFQITQPTSDSDGVFTYTSSNQEVATIDGNMITIVGAGQITITANQSATDDYNSGSVTTTFTVNKADPNIGSLTIEEKTYGDEPFSITQPTSDSDGAFTYTSSNQEVATIINGNQINIVGAGQITITANQSATDDYNSGSVTTTFTVNKADPNIGPLTIEAKTYGDEPFSITQPTSDSDGAFTYTSDNTDVATITELNLYTYTYTALSDGVGNIVFSTTLDNDGNLYVGGYGVNKWDGNIWSSILNDTNNVYKLAFDSINNILYAGGNYGLAKWNGRDWFYFENVTQPVYSIIILNEIVYVGGRNWLSYWDIKNETMTYILNGNNELNGSIFSLAFDSNNHLYVGGNFTKINNVDFNYIAKFNGTNWISLGGANGEVRTLAFDSNDNLYAGGKFNMVGDTNAHKIAKWNGVSWSSVVNTINNDINVIKFNSKNMYVGGWFTNIEGVTANYIAVWNGNSWSAIENGMNTSVTDISVTNNALYVGGWFTIANNIHVNHITKILIDKLYEIFIKGTGQTTITANQSATDDYNSGSVSAIFNVVSSSPTNPVNIYNYDSLLNFLNTDSVYGKITNNIYILDELIAEGEKIIVFNNANLSIKKFRNNK